LDSNLLNARLIVFAAHMLLRAEAQFQSSKLFATIQDGKAFGDNFFTSANPTGIAVRMDGS
jgi:hypothetical protein